MTATMYKENQPNIYNTLYSIKCLKKNGKEAKQNKNEHNVRKKNYVYI